MDYCATTYLLQVEGMEYGQHTTQSQQPASEKILNTPVHHFASGQHWSSMQHPPGKGGIQWNWQHSVLKFHETPEPGGSSTSSNPTNAPNSTNRSIKDYLRNTDMNTKHKLKTSKREASRRMKQEETQKQKKTTLQ